MSIEEFKATLNQPDPPSSLSPLLQSLWHAGKDNWEEAHNIAQDIPGPDGAWVHAYLHRVEGDNWNADYWYRRANRSMPQESLEEEWKKLVGHFVPRSSR